MTITRRALRGGKRLALGLLALPALSGVLAAQDGGESALDTGDTAWVLVSCAFVLLMTPGLALFYGGMVRTKNVLGTMMHSIFCMGLVSLQWVLFGYSIAFGKDVGGLFGNFDYAFLSGVAQDASTMDLTIPDMLFMSFQMMFAIITPALISGAFAERVRFLPFCLFTLLWATFVYDPICHWVWGGGILSDGGWLGQTVGVGAKDFAGGTVVHISSGVSALVFALMIGRRKGYPARPMLPHNLVYTVLGAGLLWFGWFGFNAGSALASGGDAVLAFTTTHICAASAAFGWAIVEWFHRGKASILGVATGLVAGLVCITPAAAFVGPMSALIMGLIVALICYIFVAFLKVRLGYDDSLDAFGVHGVGGTVGALCTGIFFTGLSEVGVKQIGAQAIGVVVTAVYAATATAILVAVLRATVGVRVNEDDEETGLDVTQHGEVGLNL